MLQKPHHKITTVYLLAASLWIVFSDSIVYFDGLDESLKPWVSIMKGMAFVLVTSAILFVYSRGLFERRFQLEAELRDQVQHVQQSRVALAESEHRFRKAVEEAPVPTVIFAEDGEVLAISRSWTEITGYDREQLKTIDDWAELAYGSGKQPVKDQIDELFELPHRVDEGDFTIRCHDGSQRIWEFSSTPLGSLADGRRAVVSVANDVTVRRQAESYRLETERLRARFQKEQEHNTFVQRIISALSHDLRTPLTVISISSDLLRRHFDRMTTQKRAEKLDTIGRQVQYALELLEDTVSMARGSSSEARFRPAPVNVAALCQISVNEVQAAQRTTHRLHFDNLSSIETATVDEVLVSRILFNLLSNAIKYSPEGSEVRLELDDDENHIALRVIDQGIGISETDVAQIFDPFFRSKAVSSVSGTGLGLSIVKDCVERHHGRISVESTLGKGSTFMVELPLNPNDQRVSVSAPDPVPQR